MQTTPVKSSNVRAVGYDESKRELRVEFNNGRTHDFLDVPPEKHRALMAAESKGQYFYRNIRDNYAQRKMAPQQDEPGAQEPSPRLRRVVRHETWPHDVEPKPFPPLMEEGEASPEAALGEAVKRYQERPEKPGR